jgi:O-acetyl-ADP-ribose deacetylase (regulator of RNase III)
MKIEYKSDNIITAPEPLIIHGCNCQGVMGSGVALAIRNRFPRAFGSYRATYIGNDNKLELGTVIFVTHTDPVTLKYIGNCMTQEYYGRVPNTQYCDYNAIEKCLLEVKSFCVDSEIDSFAMPKIGCGLGGGDWNIVSNIIEKVFIDSNITITIYDNQKIATQSNRNPI